MGLRVVVIGATGVFGSRIARRLARDPRFSLVIAGRRLSALEALRTSIDDPQVQVVTLDVDSEDFPRDLARLQPQLVIHTAGPFQRQDYRVAEACLACDSDYIDLADGRASYAVSIAWMSAPGALAACWSAVHPACPP